MFVHITKLIEDLMLDVIVKGDDEKKVDISNINRPGLQLAGYFDYFAHERIQVLGKAEMSYLDNLILQLELIGLNITLVLIFHAWCFQEIYILVMR